MHKRPDLSLGIVLLLVGAFALLVQLQVIHVGWDVLWPLILIGIGAAFHISAWAGGRRAAGLLVPGGILLTYGALFMVCAVAGWDNMRTLWPIFILGPAIGLFELYLFGSGTRGLLIPVTILFTIGMIFLLSGIFSRGYEIVLSLGVIAAGAIVIGASLLRPWLTPPVDPGKKAAEDDSGFRPPEPPRYVPPVIPAPARYAPPVYPEPPRVDLSAGETIMTDAQPDTAPDEKPAEPAGE